MKMSFKYETIENESYLKVDRQIIRGKGAVFVTPTSLPENFPIDFPELKHCVLTNRYKDLAERIKNFEVRSDDTWVVTYMKAGTTWTQEMVWLLKNNLDFEGAKSASLRERFPFLEISGIRDFVGVDTVEVVEKMPSPRFIKSHLPIQLLPDDLWSTRNLKPKIVYVKRNPKDVAVSYFHHSKMLFGYSGTMDELIDIFVQDYGLYGPFFDHVVDFCQAAEKLDNILVLSYEDMKKDLTSVIKVTAKFLEVSISESDVGKLVDHLSFKNMRENDSINFNDLIEISMKELGTSSDIINNSKFVRKGEVGSWKEELSTESIEKLNFWIKRHEEANPIIKKYFDGNI